MAPEEIVVAFNEAVNARDLDVLSGLMTEEHRFVDTAGSVISGKTAGTEAWQDFFAAFPDYRNVFTTVTASEGDAVEVLGYSECSVPELAGPARWRALLVDGLVDEWRVDAPVSDR